jgi:hypothetical protein
VLDVRAPKRRDLFLDAFAHGLMKFAIMRTYVRQTPFASPPSAPTDRPTDSVGIFIAATPWFFALLVPWPCWLVVHSNSN